MKIHILSSTDRPNSNALKLASLIKKKINIHVEATIFSLLDYPLKDVAGGKYGDTPPAVKKFNQEFLDGDALLFVIPEYNGGFPGILKVFFDYLPFPNALDNKPVSMIGEAAGSFGALRPVEQFGQLLIYRKALLYPERLFIQKVNDHLSEDGLTEKMDNLLLNQLTGFITFSRKVLESV